MFKTLLQRIFNPAVGGVERAALAIGLLVGLLVALAAALSGSGPVAVIWGLAALAAVSVPTRFIYRSQNRVIQEARDLWGLQGLTHTESRLWPAPGGWALGPGALAFLVDDIRRSGHRNAVELGPGVSSVVLGKATPELEVFGLEHDERFVEIVTDQLAMQGIEGYELIHAPLEVGSEGVAWYSRDALDRLPESIDVLIVDGPPNWKGQGRRRPAWQQLGSRMRPGGLVLVDDTHRHDERSMASEWLGEPGLELAVDGYDFMALRVVGNPG